MPARQEAPRYRSADVTVWSHIGGQVRRTLAAVIVAALMPVVLPPATAVASAKARIEVVIKAPRGLIAQVQLTRSGTKRQVLRASTSPRTVRSIVPVAPGPYRVSGKP